MPPWAKRRDVQSMDDAKKMPPANARTANAAILVREMESGMGRM